jgi:lysozyme family protein
MSAFEDALAYTFKNEGGFNNIPEDHGGATKYGITIGDLARWRRQPVSVADVKALTVDEAKQIYKAWYWDVNDLDQIDKTEAIAIFDIGVVCGVTTSAKLAQATCCQIGEVIAVDGHVGQRTIAALNKVHLSDFIHTFAGRVETRFRTIVANNPSQAKFLRGWVNRARRLLTLA